MIALTPLARWTYVLERERLKKLDDGTIVPIPRDEQTTTFELEHLSLSEEQALLDDIGFDEHGNRIRKNRGSVHLRMLRTKLVGWTNFRDKDGTAVAFEKGPLGGAKDELLRRISLGDREELANAIENQTAFTQAELGESSQPST